MRQVTALSMSSTFSLSSDRRLYAWPLFPQSDSINLTKLKENKTNRQRIIQDALDCGRILQGAFWEIIYYSLRNAAPDQVLG
jgi:hypothetical protein